MVGVISLLVGIIVCITVKHISAQQTSRLEIRMKSPFTRLNNWINLINNNNQSTWKARKNFYSDLSPKYIKALLGTLPTPKVERRLKYYSKSDLGVLKNIKLPESFDARTKWNTCKSVSMIRDQGECGSCWAVAAASVFGDRLCIESKGKINFLISAEEPLACCESCGGGCEGGYVDEVWRFFQRNGAVTGGEYHSAEGCLPYSKEPCEHTNYTERRYKKCESLDPMITPLCLKNCSNKQYQTSFANDHKKATIVFMLPPDQKIIQSELYMNGPLQVVYEVYEDFLSYESGVYKQTISLENCFLGFHSVKLIGWGTDNKTNVPYWLVINSWNDHWGSNGTFKLIRGINNCNFEANVYGCITSANNEN